MLDELFADAQQHLAAAGYAAHALPFETFLLAMLLEERKRSQRQAQMIDELRVVMQRLETGGQGSKRARVLDEGMGGAGEKGSEEESDMGMGELVQGNEGDEHGKG